MILAVAEICPLITTLLVWKAIFLSSGKSNLQGYDTVRIMTYALLSFPIQRFVGLWFMDYEIASDIRNGQINSFLLRPINYLYYRWTLVAGRKVIMFMSVTIPYIIIFYVLRHSILPPINWGAILYCIIFCIFGLFLNFLITYCAGLVAFWLLDVSSLFFIYYIMSFFLAGGMFPLDMMPKPIYQAMQFLPFQYMGFFQIKIYLGDFYGEKTFWGLIILAGWILCFLGIAKLLWNAGTRKYSAYGG